MLSAVLLFALLPQGPVPASVALLERNHCIDPATGQQRFVQLIHWNRYGRSLHVDFWEMDHGEYVLYPAAGDASYRLVRWKGKRFRVFRVGRIVETHTRFDPEVADRRVLAVGGRRGLPK